MRRFSLILCIVVYYAKYDAEEPLLFIISTTIILLAKTNQPNIV